MKTMTVSFLLALIGCVSAPAVEPNRADMEFRADRALQGLLSAKHSPRNGLQCWAGRFKKHGRMSDEILLDVLIDYMKRDKVMPYLGNDPNHVASPFDSVRAARNGMELYPGNPRLEAVLLEEFRRDDVTHPSHYSWLHTAASYGSDELIQEIRGLVADPRYLESFDREVEIRTQPRFARRRFPEGIRFENRVEQKTGFRFTQLRMVFLMSYCLTVLVLAVVFGKKWPRVKRIGAVAIAVGIALAVVWLWVRGIRWSPHDDAISACSVCHRITGSIAMPAGQFDDRVTIRQSTDLFDAMRLELGNTENLPSQIPDSALQSMKKPALPFGSAGLVDGCM